MKPIPLESKKAIEDKVVNGLLKVAVYLRRDNLEEAQQAMEALFTWIHNMPVEGQNDIRRSAKDIRS